jgi:oligopeptide transport system permease protein
MKKNKNKLYDSQQSSEVTAQDFEFVNVDKAIHDVKFETKPTTFFKDAFIRFTKNKSSVVAGILIGILITMAIFVPILNDSVIDRPLNVANFLPPRWRGFEGSGFMDGTRKYNNIVVDSITDPNNPSPAGYDYRAVVGEMDTYEAFVTSPSPYAQGGAVVLRPRTRTANSGIVSPHFYLNSLNEYEWTVVLDSFNREAFVTPKYMLAIDVKFSSDYEFQTIVFKDFSSDFDNLTYTFTNIMTDHILENLPDDFEYIPGFVFESRFRIMVETVPIGTYPALYVNSAMAANSNNASDTTFDLSNFDDANELLLRDLTTGRIGSWRIAGDGTKNLYNAIVLRANFTYDSYLAAFGEKRLVVGVTRINQYIANGWIEYDFSVGISSFVMLSDKSPIREVLSQKTTTAGGITVQEVTAIVSFYRYYGFDEIPYYFFGTNHRGVDYFKVIFSGLRTSLILGFMAAMINVMVGLVWGAISGYFGGAVDITMERFTEILGGIPWIVVMTLAILHLGNNFGVFLLALCLTGWIGVSSTTRAQFYRYKRREYILASRTLGASDWRLIFRHILPNSIGPIVTGAVLIIPGVIFAEATISYLGLGLQGLPSFGVALSEAQGFLSTSPYLMYFGAIVISILMISFNLFGNGLRDAFNPSLKGVD